MPTITRIAEQRKRKNRRNIFLDGAFAFGCNINVVARFRLREGLNLSADEVARIQQGEVRQECLDDALGMLQRRLHSESELQRKLTRKEYGPAVIEAVMDDLKRLGYLDDARFAKTRALSAAQHKHHGKRRAKLELMKAGVDADTADKALEDVYDAHDSLAVARTLAQKQASRLKKLEPAVARRRLVGMLQRRGFDYETIKPIVDQVLGDERDE
jgi:regulatory protein